MEFVCVARLRTHAHAVTAPGELKYDTLSRKCFNVNYVITFLYLIASVNAHREKTCCNVLISI